MAPQFDGTWPGLIPLRELPRRGRASCCGVADAITFQPADAAPSFTVILTDREGPEPASDAGNHRLRLVWIGRAHIPGILAGTRLRVEGMVSQRAGLPTMYNPRYEIIGSQES